MNEVSEFLGLPAFDYSSVSILEKSWGGGSSNRFGSQSYQPLSGETRDNLKKFFEPYNRALYDLIGRDMEWD